MRKIFDSISELPDSVRDRLTTAQQRQWLRVWNSVFEREREGGASVEDAEGAAFTQANGVVKGRSRLDFDKRVEIEKADEEQQMVWGWAYLTTDENGRQVVDHGGDVVSIDEIQKAAEEFMLESRVGGVMHEDQAGFVSQSIVITDDLARELGFTTRKRGWLIGFKVTDPEVWEGVKSGRFRAFSIGGTANPEEIHGAAA
jgi:cation transport regulator ChaB